MAAKGKVSHFSLFFGNKNRLFGSKEAASDHVAVGIEDVSGRTRSQSRSLGIFLGLRKSQGGSSGCTHRNQKFSGFAHAKLVVPIVKVPSQGHFFFSAKFFFFNIGRFFALKRQKIKNCWMQKNRGNFLGKSVPVVEFPQKRRFQLPNIYYQRTEEFRYKIREFKRVPERPLRWAIFFYFAKVKKAGS
jgi:hypothetical protein